MKQDMEVRTAWDAAWWKLYIKVLLKEVLNSMAPSNKDVKFNREEYKDFFEEITGFRPYDFQVEIAEKMINGKNVVMQAPTGAGKTWACIVPFLYAAYKGIEFPRKLIYSLPLRVLANSLYEEINNGLKRLSKLFKRELKVTIQTGENSQDPYFIDGDIIFTTIDQSISSLLSIPLSLSLGQGNINPGAVFSSYLVFDEFHLLEVNKALSTVYNILSKVKDITPVCLMTATLSDRLLDNYCSGINAEKIIINRKEIENIKSQKNKTRKVIVKNQSIDVKNIIREHKNRTIVICNRVDKCKGIYIKLQEEISNNSALKDTHLICIHSQFFTGDRKKKEQLIKEYFGKGSSANAILIATQVIEVGIDISCEVMHTEICPINSFLQRIGRCARYENESGVIFVYDVDKKDEKGEEKKRPYLPYDKDFCINTFEHLNKLDPEENLDYYRSQDLVNAILTDKESKDFMSITQDIHNRFDDIAACWLKPERSYASKLIREVDSISVLLCDNPENLNNPYELDTISINRDSLIGKLSKIEKEGDNWLIKIVTESNFDDDFFGKYSYPEISVNDSRARFENLLILNPRYVFYDEGIGLNFEGIGEKQSVKVEKKSNKKRFAISKDTYEEHVELMIKAYEALFRENTEYFFSKLRHKYNMEYKLNEIVRFMIVIHDYGKLNRTWQAKVRQYQRTKDNYKEGEILAHTDFDPEKDEGISLPNHAGIGGIVACNLIEGISDNLESLALDILNAITKHHSVNSFSSEKYKIVEGGKEVVMDLLGKHCPNLITKINCNEELLTKCDTRIEFTTGEVIPFSKIEYDYGALLYFALVRILRICDQKSFDFKEKRGD